MVIGMDGLETAVLSTSASRVTSLSSTSQMRAHIVTSGNTYIMHDLACLRLIIKVQRDY
jgi:hypothetical protein